MLNAQLPGDLDTTFSHDGFVVTSVSTGEDYRHDIAIQADGKIIVAGSTGNYSHVDFALVRFNTDGSLDSSFDADGILITDLGGNDYCNAVAVQPDGKIIGAGTMGALGSRYAVVRYNTDGSFDETFGDGGVRLLDFGAGAEEIFDIKLLDDGKILFGGWNDKIGDDGIGDGDNFSVGRLLADGTPDSTFSDDGLVTVSYADDEYLFSLAVQPDGKIVAGGKGGWDAYFDLELMRFTEDGELDNTFSGDGKYALDEWMCNLTAYSIALQPDGKIVTAGNGCDGFVYDYFVMRFNTDGTPDNTFGVDGKVETYVGAGMSMGQSVLIQPDNKILVGGYAKGVNFDFTVVRYNTDGSVDLTFGDEGAVLTHLGTGSDEIHTMQLQEDGQLVVAGNSANGADGKVFSAARYYLGMDLTCLDFIAVQPKNDTVPAGETAMFTAHCTSPDAMYQWQKLIDTVWTDLTDDAIHSGAHNDTLLVAAPYFTFVPLRYYRCIINYSICPDTTATAMMKIVMGFSGADDDPDTTVIESAADQLIEYLSISPNPAHDIFTLSGLSQLDDAVVYITDISGKTISAFHLYGLDGDAQPVAVRSFAPGMYFVKIRHAENETCLKLLVY